MRIETLDRLKVRIVGGSDGAGGGQGPVVVLLHGYGAPGDDLVPLARFLSAPPGTSFVFPEAPVPLPSILADSRAWWMIDIDALERAMTGQMRDLSSTVPVGLAEARAHVIGLLDAIPGALGADPGAIFLGGFSQGAMLSCDVALHADLPLAGVALLSATFLAASEWRPRMAKRRGLNVLQSHGRMDPLLPFAVAEQLRDELRSAGLAVEWHAFSGGHEIPPAVVTALGSFLSRTLGGESNR